MPDVRACTSPPNGSSAPAHLEPFLTTMAVPRTETAELPGRYCPKRHVWVVDDGHGPNAIVSTAEALVELLTKTKVHQERDDMNLSSSVSGSTCWRPDAVAMYALLEIATKTEVRRERDDR